MSDPFAEYEVERLAQIEREEAVRDTPEAAAARKARKASEFAKGVRLGWWDVDGNVLVPETDEDEDEEADEDE